MAPSPRRRTALAAALLLALGVTVTGAEPVTITLRASDTEPMHDPATAEVLIDVAGALAARDAHAAHALPQDILAPGRALDAARSAGLKEGVAPWRATLGFSSAHGKIVWRVSNTTRAEPGNTEGRVFTIDGRDGKLIVRDRWHVVVG